MSTKPNEPKDRPELAKRVPPDKDMAVCEGGIKIRTVDDLVYLSKIIAHSNLAPRGLDTPAKIMVAMTYGIELGFGPMQSLWSIYVVGGRPELYCDAAFSLVLSKGLLARAPEEEYILDKEGNVVGAVCRLWRKGWDKPIESIFTIQMAKAANLIKAGSAWALYKERMLKMRARKYALKDGFADVFRGVVIADFTRQDIEELGHEAFVEDWQEEQPNQSQQLPGLTVEMTQSVQSPVSNAELIEQAASRKLGDDD